MPQKNVNIIKEHRECDKHNRQTFWIGWWYFNVSSSTSSSTGYYVFFKKEANKISLILGFFWCVFAKYSDDFASNIIHIWFSMQKKMREIYSFLFYLPKNLGVQNSFCDVMLTSFRAYQILLTIWRIEENNMVYFFSFAFIQSHIKCQDVGFCMQI